MPSDPILQVLDSISLSQYDLCGTRYNDTLHIMVGMFGNIGPLANNNIFMR